MSKNTASLAQAISLMSDVLSREVFESESNDIKDIIDNEEPYDDLKEQVLDFGQEIADGLNDISNELDQALDQAESDADDGNAWTSFEGYDPAADEIVPLDDDDEVDEAESGNGEVDISETESGANDAESEPTDDEKAQTLILDVAILEKKNAELEKNKEELGDKIEDLIDTIRTSAAQIENLNATADAFVSEVESL